MVVITIIWILVWAGTQVNFNKVWEANKIIIFNNSIVSQFETIRNNSLLWKWVDSNIWVPDAWRLEYTNVWSGGVNISYSSGWWIPVPSLDITASNFHSISEINCFSATWGLLNANVASAFVDITGNDIQIAWDCNIQTKKLQFTTQLKNASHSIEINALNWLIEID